jgi:hypothetical protein
MKTRPVSLRLAEREIETLAARATEIGGTPTGIARQLIRAGLAGGDMTNQGERLMLIERRLVVIEQQNQSIVQAAVTQAETLQRLLKMFDALIAALSCGDAAQEAEPS